MRSSSSSFTQGRRAAQSQPKQGSLARRRRRARRSLERAIIDTLETRLLFSSIANGGFESQDVGSASYYPLPANSYWSFSGDSGVASNGGVPGTSLNAPEGSQVGVLSSSGSSATISQSFDPGAGSTSVHFMAANAQGGAVTLYVLVDGNTVGSFTPGDSGYSSYSVDAFSQSTSGSHTIAFTASGGPVLIDAVEDETGPLQPPSFGAPSLSSNSNPNSISVSWSSYAWGADSYSIERSVDGSSFSSIGTTSGTSFDDTAVLLPDLTYYYRVTASGSSYGSITSEAASITTPSTGVPAPIPTAIWAHEVDVAIPSGAPDSPFKLLRSTDGQYYSDLTIDGTSIFTTSDVLHDTTVLPDTTYYYRIAELGNFCQSGELIGDPATATTPRELLIHLGAAQTRVTQGGRSFVLDLDAAGNPSGSDVVGWDITWGDGSGVQHVNGNPHSVPHN